MQPAVIEGWNVRPGAPKDWDEARNGRCGALHVRVEVDEGLQYLTSAWEPTPGELAALNAGAKVEISICGAVHPVLRLGVGPVPEDAS